jgi:signal transduction histidine kinase
MIHKLLPYLRQVFRSRRKFRVQSPPQTGLQPQSGERESPFILVPTDPAPLLAEPTNLSAAIQGWVNGFKSMASDRGVFLSLERSHSDWMARCETDTLEQIVSSLLVHALTVTQQGGRATVNVSCEPAGITLRISDTGEVQPPPKNDPATLSLATLGIELIRIRELVDRLDGSLGVASVVGTGTTFTVWLPIRQHTESLLTSPVQANSK